MWSISNLFLKSVWFEIRNALFMPCLLYCLKYRKLSKRVGRWIFKTTISNCDCIQSNEMSKVLQGTNLSHQNVRQRSPTNLALRFFLHGYISHICDISKLRWHNPFFSGNQSSHAWNSMVYLRNLVPVFVFARWFHNKWMDHKVKEVDTSDQGYPLAQKLKSFCLFDVL